MKTSIATVSISGDLGEKLHAIASAGFDGIEIFETDFLTFDGSPSEVGGGTSTTIVMPGKLSDGQITKISASFLTVSIPWHAAPISIRLPQFPARRFSLSSWPMPQKWIWTFCNGAAITATCPAREICRLSISCKPLPQQAMMVPCHLKYSMTSSGADRPRPLLSMGNDRWFI